LPYDLESMHVSLLIDGIPPDRTHSGQRAYRHSPNADPLAPQRRASWRDPQRIPLREPFGIRVVLGRTKPAFEGYGAIDPIIEVLVDVGMIDLTPDFGRPSLS
jgi:hypothetical protein